MRQNNVSYAAYVAAYAADHSLIYRAREVWVDLYEEACLPASDEMVFVALFSTKHM
ncbi:hypothetical protein [Ktedonobacter robiniae]|nr:hypothetical protein [Ktedonobacter robiniae]